MIPGAPRDASWSVIQGVRVSTGVILRAAPNGLIGVNSGGSGCQLVSEDEASGPRRTPIPPARLKGARGITPHLGPPIPGP
jgi:hypothetical protein